jgi:hypothetical protein
MKAIAKEIASASETTQVTLMMASMWTLCALLIIFE